MSETNEPAEPPKRSRWGIDPERLAAIRQRAGEAAKNATGSGDPATFRRFKAAKDAQRAIDGVTGKDQPE